MLGYDSGLGSQCLPAANKNMNFSLTKIQLSCLRPLGLKLMMTEEEETKCMLYMGPRGTTSVSQMRNKGKV